jgi:hypothetical protein
MADWARDYSPFVKIAQENKGIPDFEVLLPKYLKFAEQAKNNEEFYQLVSGYNKLINPLGHNHLLSEGFLRLIGIPVFWGIIDVDISYSQIKEAIYWPRLAFERFPTLNQRPTNRVHPPFGITYTDDKYFTDDDWAVEAVIVPRGSRILKVNGMNCLAYLDYVREHTPLRYDPYPKDWIKEYLLVIDEGTDFKGWQVEFLLPDQSTYSALVPKIKGFPDSKKEKTQTIEAKENCTYIELTDEVAYIRIKSMFPPLLAFIFPSIYEKDGQIIKTFLDNAKGKYNKLIIDVRNNLGGIPYYFYENLIRPFLDESVTYDQVAGIKKKYKDNLKESVLEALRSTVSDKKQHVVSVEEIEAPEGFDENEWIFYRITRKIEPRNRYNFHGDIYVLINGGSFSATDNYANEIKRIGFAKLVGQSTTGSCAAYISAPAIRLPASGMIFRTETELVINPDGSVNELVGTSPDIELPDADPPKSITKEDLLKDEWIKYILAI